jgi:hypothetical protein
MSFTTRPADADLAGGREFEPRQHPQRRRLAAARGPEQRDELALVDGQVEPVDGGEAAEDLADGFEKTTSATRYPFTPPAPKPRVR